MPSLHSAEVLQLFGVEMQRMSTLFISYSTNDRPTAEIFYHKLAEMGYERPFRDDHPDAGIPAGSDWEENSNVGALTDHPAFASWRLFGNISVLAAAHSNE